MMLRELRLKPRSSVVWVWWKDHDRGKLKDGLMYVQDNGDGTWALRDKNQLNAEFAPTDERDEAGCVDDCMGEGELRLYHALEGA